MATPVDSTIAQHGLYDPEFLSNEIEDQYLTDVNLFPYITVDNTLEGGPGFRKVINTYHATDATQDLKMGEGNDEEITVNYTSKEYTTKMAQNRFRYYDEQAMQDPIAIVTGVRHMGTDMWNKVQTEIFDEFDKAEVIIKTTNLDFDAFVDASVAFNSENVAAEPLFAFVNPADIGAIRKKCKDTLQYVESYARSGYVGTIAGIPLIQYKLAKPGEVIVATRKAVTMFNKKGTQVEIPPRDSADANIRLNTMYSRKYYMAVLTDATQVVKLTTTKSFTACASTETTVDENETYYAKSGNVYTQVHPVGTESPYAKGWYKLSS